MKKRIYFFLLLVAVATALTGFTSKAAETDNLSMSQDKIVGTVGGTTDLDIKGLDQLTDGYQVEWVSSEPSCVSVDDNGLVTLLAQCDGITVNANITLADNTVFSLTCEIYASNPSLSSPTLTIGPKIYSALAIEGITTQSVVTYSSDNPGVASVTAAGYVYGLTYGSTTIRVNVDGKELTCTIYISAPIISAPRVFLVKEKTKTLTVSNTSGATPVVWSSSNAAIANVSTAGKVTTYKKGTAYITANVDGINIVCAVNVGSKKTITVIKKAIAVLGTKYSQARRMSANYYDCSSLVWRMFKTQKAYFGCKSYAPTAAEEARYMVRKKKVVAKKYVSQSKLLPGDVIFVSRGYNGRYRNICHTAIYIGGGMLVHANGIKVDYGYYDNYKSTISLIARPLK